MNHHENKKDGLEQLAQKFSSRYTDWRPNLLHGMSTAVFVGSRTVDSLLPPSKSQYCNGNPLTPRVSHTHTLSHTLEVEYVPTENLSSAAGPNHFLAIFKGNLFLR